MCGPCFDVLIVSRRRATGGVPGATIFEEGKYNMNIPSLLNTISYCILILYAYKDFLATLSFIYIPWVAFWLVVLGVALSHVMVLFLINLINGYMQLNSESGPLCCVLEWLTSP
jgi:hypothetical protein